MAFVEMHVGAGVAMRCIAGLCGLSRTAFILQKGKQAGRVARSYHYFGMSLSIIASGPTSAFCDNRLLADIPEPTPIAT